MLGTPLLSRMVAEILYRMKIEKRRCSSQSALSIRLLQHGIFNCRIWEFPWSRPSPSSALGDKVGLIQLYHPIFAGEIHKLGLSFVDHPSAAYLLPPFLSHLAGMWTALRSTPYRIFQCQVDSSALQKGLPFIITLVLFQMLSHLAQVHPSFYFLEFRHHHRPTTFACERDTMQSEKDSSTTQAASSPDDFERQSVDSSCSDDALLNSLGKTAELKRVYNFWTCKIFVMPDSLANRTDAPTRSMCLPGHDQRHLELCCCSLRHNLRSRRTSRSSLRIVRILSPRTRTSARRQIANHAPS